jgi:CspA family cold shock protein
MTGIIKKITADRGFGFITSDEGLDYFFHQSELRGGLVFAQLKEGLRVSFQPARGEKGLRAADVTPA